MANRRTVLKGMAATLGTTLLPGCGDAGERHVLIVGAGIAGLAAGAALRRGGVAVTIIEARPRIGGRIATSRRWPDLPVDLGASWIHGTRGNPLTALAREVDARLVPTSYDSTMLHIEPELAALGVRDRATPAMAAILRRARSIAARAETDMSVADAIALATNDRTLTPAARSQLAFHLNATLEQEYSGSVTRMSAWAYDEGQEFGGSDALFPDGYDQILRPLRKGIDIRLGTEVTAVRADTKGVTVETAQGGRMAADAVIMTVPLGVLKTEAIRFDPPLSPAKTAAITRLGMGLLNKHWLRFDRVRWPIGADWHEYLSRQPDSWSEWVSLAKIDNTPVLLAFSAADHAERMERLPERDRLAAIMETARAMFGSALPDPAATQMTRWRDDPYARGSYSFYAVGSSPADRRALSQAEGRIHFAGEAQSVRHPGTVHGALLSGTEAARQIIEELSHP